MFLRKSNFLLISLLFFIFTVSCVSTSSKKKEFTSPTGIQIRQTESSRQIKAMNERILMSTLSSQRDLYRDYKIGPEDLVEISVFEEERLNKTVRVSSQGNISLPLLGILRVKGFTANELEKEIRDLLAEKYLQDPHVGVFIREYRNQRISVMGAVVKSGVYDVTGQKTILDLLSLAGGLKEDTSQFAGPLLFLIRPPNLEGEASKKGTESDEQKPKTFIINLEELLVKGDLTLNLPVLHGDVINVPSAGKVFVGGEVKRPGGFPLSRNMTLSQAITSAEGVTPKAQGSKVKIFRYSEMRTEKDIISVDVYAIQKGKGEDLLLKENDIIFVPKSDSKAFLLGFWDFFKGRLGSVYYPLAL